MKLPQIRVPPRITAAPHLKDIPHLRFSIVPAIANNAAALLLFARLIRMQMAAVIYLGVARDGRFGD